MDLTVLLNKVNAFADSLHLFPVKDALCICIEGDCVKLVGIEFISDKTVINNFALVHPDEEDALISDPIERAASIIKKALSKGAFKGKHIFTLVMEGALFLRKVSLPDIPEKELSNALRWEASHHIPFNIDTAFFDWEFLGTAQTREGVTNNEYMIAATNKITVDHLSQVMSSLSAELVAVCVPAFAMYNIVQRSEQFSAEETTIFIDIGRKKSNIVFFEGKTLSFSGISGRETFLRKSAPRAKCSLAQKH